MRRSEKIKTIHENSFGSISKCPCCEDIQVTLGNVVLTFSEEEYVEFDLFFDEIRRDFETLEGKTAQKYIIRTNRNGLALSLTHQELEATLELFNFSKIIRSANKLIN